MTNFVSPTTWSNLSNIPNTGARQNIKDALTKIENALNTNLATSSTEPGEGFSGGTGTVLQSSVQNVGNIITTQYLIDLTGLDSSGTAGDIIGLALGDGNGGVAYFGRVTEAQNGAVFAGTLRCLEVPTGGDPDVDLWASSADTGAFDQAVAGLAGAAQLLNTGDWTLEEDTLTALPANGSYLYLATGATDDATYTAGKFLLTLYGIPA